MKAVICALAVLLSVAVTTANGWQTAPSFCHGLNCPNFTSVANCTSDNFEIRHYPSAAWVSVAFEGPGTSSFKTAVQEGFQDLFQYISGANSKSEAIDMTAPVLNKVTPGAGPNCNTTFVVSFFIPYLHQDNAPKPTNSKVYLRQQSNLTVAVRSFGGWVDGWSDSVVPELHDLGKSLTKAGLNFTQGEEWVAQYNSPFTIFNRHNEVWYPLVGGTDKLKC